MQAAHTPQASISGGAELETEDSELGVGKGRLDCRLATADR
jgi:hypothetical protein